MFNRNFAFRNSVRSAQALTNDDIFKVAPSVFADGAHESRSERYAHIPTIQVIEGLRTEGFFPYYAAQSRTLKAGKADHTKHIVRFRHHSMLADETELREVVLINSHDGTSAYNMSAGVFRLVCANGLMAYSPEHEVNIRHAGKVLDNVVSGAHLVLDGLTRVIEDREEMRGIELNQEEQHAFANAALMLRYDEGKAPIDPTQALEWRRHEDRGDNLWSAFNRVQENLTKGGQRGVSANRRRITTRGLTGIDADVKFNRALWALADEMRKLKSN